MKLLACVLLLASSARVELLDETPTIAREKWNYFEVNLRQRPATVEASFEVQSGAKQVRLALMTHADEERLHEGEPHGVLAATPLGSRGSLTFDVRRPDDYAIVVDNREGDRATTVRVRVALDFGRAPAPDVTRASPERQVIVVALSFAFFFGVVTYSARRILRAIRK
jgi:hypothetical protein